MNTNKVLQKPLLATTQMYDDRELPAGTPIRSITEDVSAFGTPFWNFQARKAGEDWFYYHSEDKPVTDPT